MSITVTSLGTGLTRKIVTSQSGNYAVPLLPVGVYSVTAEASGFKKKTTIGIVLEVDQEPRVDILLEVGAVTDAVTVTAEASVLQTENAVVGQVVDNRYTTQILLNEQLLRSCCCFHRERLRVREVSIFRVGSATGSSGSGIAIGGRDSQNNFTLDGASNNARQFGNIAMRPSIDAIQEFKVQTNSYTADLGQAAFGQVSLITKSGTNSLHGSLFEFWRNNVFDARNTFLPKASRLNRNQFGGAAGGPIRRNKSFFFVNYEQHTERRGVESFRSVPVQAWRDGDFSSVAGLTLKDPSSGLPFAGNRIPKNLFSKTANAAIALWPQQNFGGPATVSQNLLVTAPDRFSDGMLTVKIDHELTGKDRLSGRYSHPPGRNRR